MVALEQRMVFDGAIAVTDPTLFDRNTGPDLTAIAEAAARAVSADVPREATRREIAFVDNSLSDLQGLLAGIGNAAEVVQIDHAQDGLAQINAALAGRGTFDAIHILAHGGAGSQTIGATTLDAAHLDTLKSELSSLGASLSADGDLLLYGCDVAQGAAGQALVQQLAHLTGADVAASINRTGATGDWVLEQSSGAIEARTLSATDWQGDLAITVTGTKVNEGSPFAPFTVTGLTAGSTITLGVADKTTTGMVNADIRYSLDNGATWAVYSDPILVPSTFTSSTRLLVAVSDSPETAGSIAAEGLERFELSVSALSATTAFTVVTDNFLIAGESERYTNTQLSGTKGVFGFNGAFDSSKEVFTRGLVLGGKTIGSITFPLPVVADEFGGANGSKFVTASDDAPVTIKLTTPQNYFGFWWSAGDDDNILEFYKGGQLIETFKASLMNDKFPDNMFGNPYFQDDGTSAGFRSTGSTFITTEENQANIGEKYAFLNFMMKGGQTFDKVVMRGSNFEFDNLTFLTNRPTASSGLGTIVDDGSGVYLKLDANGNPVIDSNGNFVSDPNAPRDNDYDNAPSLNDCAYVAPIDLLANDVASGSSYTLNPASIKLYSSINSSGAGEGGQTLTVGTLGEFKVTPTGVLYFNPSATFNGASDRVTIYYTVADSNGSVSNRAAVVMDPAAVSAGMASNSGTSVTTPFAQTNANATELFRFDANGNLIDPSATYSVNATTKATSLTVNLQTNVDNNLGNPTIDNSRNNGGSGGVQAQLKVDTTAVTTTNTSGAVKQLAMGFGMPSVGYFGDAVDVLGLTGDTLAKYLDNPYDPKLNWIRNTLGAGDTQADFYTSQQLSPIKQDWGDFDPLTNAWIKFSTTEAQTVALRSQSTANSYKVGSFTLTFNDENGAGLGSNNPLIHIANLGDFIENQARTSWGTIGAQLKLTQVMAGSSDITASASLSKLSGNNEFAVGSHSALGANTIYNSASDVQTNRAFGTAKLNASGVTSVTFDVYLKGTWNNQAAFGGLTTYGTESFFVSTSTFIGPDSVSSGVPQTGAGADAMNGFVKVCGVNNVVVNEGSPYAIFQVGGFEGSTIKDLTLSSGTGTLGADTGTQLQYYDPSANKGAGAWIDYTGGDITIPENGDGSQYMPTKLLVRVAITNDTDPDNGDQLTLRVQYPNRAETGTLTILDNGTGSVFGANNSTGTPDPVDTRFPHTALNDDVPDPRPITINSLTVNEASPYAIFTVTGKEGQTLSLGSLTNGTGNAGADTGPGLEYFNGSVWVAYTPGQSIRLGYGTDNVLDANADASLLVRVAVTNDLNNEISETLTLTATNSGGVAATGTLTIVDRNDGVVFGPSNTTGTPDQPGAAGIPEVLDNDTPDSRPVTIDNLTVNEGSPFAVFTVGAAPGQRVLLGLPASGTADVGADTGTGLEYFNGTRWVSYIPGSQVETPASGKILVRVAIVQDTPYEGPQTFTITASNVNGDVVTGTGTIVDDGTGTLFATRTDKPNTVANEAVVGVNPDGTPLLDTTTTPDDDRPLSVNNVTVNEGSPYIVFTVTGGNEGQKIKLDTQNGTARVGVDTSSGLEYFNGTSWVAYTPGSYVTVPDNGNGTPRESAPLLVRLAVKQDAAIEGSETFKLIATNSGGKSATGIGTISDEGTGSLFAASNATGTPDPLGSPALPSTLTALDLDGNPPAGCWSLGTADLSNAFTIPAIPANQDLDWSSLDLDPAVAGIQTSKAVSVNGVSMGSYVVSGSGVTFVPSSDFRGTAPNINVAISTVTYAVHSNGDTVLDSNGDPVMTVVGTRSTTVGIGSASTAAYKMDATEVCGVSSVIVNEGSPWAVFDVKGFESGQITNLALTSGTGTAGVDTGAIEYFNGTRWVPYVAGQPITIPGDGDGTGFEPTALKVRVAIVNDAPLETLNGVGEQLTLSATYGHGAVKAGTLTIMDNGTGNVFGNGNTTGVPDVPGQSADPSVPATLNNDYLAPLQVGNVTVNEASPYLVFTVTGQEGQPVTLGLSSGTATLGLDTRTALEYFNGTAWVAYTPGSTINIPSDGDNVAGESGAPLLVRVAVTQDGIWEKSESLTLQATDASNRVSTGTGTILDDGTGTKWTFSGNTDPGTATTATTPTAGFDDDRPLAVSDVWVYESSGYAQLTVTGAPGQLATLALASGTATLGTDTAAASTMEYWNGSAWTAVPSDGVVRIPTNGDGTLQVRLAVSTDNSTETPETLTLSATNTGGRTAVGTVTILDGTNPVPFAPGNVNVSQCWDPVTINVLANDKSLNGGFDTSSVLLYASEDSAGVKTLVTDFGTYQVNDNGTVTFTPVVKLPNQSYFDGTASVVYYSVLDGTVRSPLGEIRIGGEITPASVTTGVPMDGNQTQVQPGMWSVSGASTQNRTTVSAGGTNLIANGDFTPPAGSVAYSLVSISDTESNGYYPYAPLPGWTTSGGGEYTYAVYGNLGSMEFPIVVAPEPTGANSAAVYFGNAAWLYYGTLPQFNVDNVGVLAPGETLMFVSPISNYSPWNGIPPTPADHDSYWGPLNVPVAIHQTVNGLTVGQSYRLQFWASPEEGYVGGRFQTQGLAAFDVSGYDRTYFTIPVSSNSTPVGTRYTIDFVAKSASTAISFMNWGHISNVFPGSETELILDDVILTSQKTNSIVNDGIAAMTKTCGINDVVVNEASPWAVFTVNGVEGQTLTLDLKDGTGIAGVDTSGLQYLDPADNTWKPYTPGQQLTLPNDGDGTVEKAKILVRVGIVNDAPFEQSEQLTLAATFGNGLVETGTLTILDNGTGDVFLGSNKTPVPNAPTDAGYPAQLNNDRGTGPQVNSIVVNEASPYAVFTINGVAGAGVNLALGAGANPATTAELTGTDADIGSTLEFWNAKTNTWVTYTPGTPNAVVNPDGQLLVRVAVNQDRPLEVSEDFTLTATYNNKGVTSGITVGGASTGQGVIKDDGTGTIFVSSATDPGVNNLGQAEFNLDAPKDNDALNIDNLQVNEGSPYAVFTVNSLPGAQYTLSLGNRGSTPDTAISTGASADYVPAIEVFNGTAWVLYNGTDVLTSPTGKLLARVALNNQVAMEGPEAFTIRATQSNGLTALGTATIYDDGTGQLFGAANTTGTPDPVRDPASTNADPSLPTALDDDGTLAVNSVTVNEASPYIIFTVTGDEGRAIQLGTISGTAVVGTDTGTALEYFNGTAWVAYTPGSFINIPSDADPTVNNPNATLLVRMAVVQDKNYEVSESFKLTATTKAGRVATGTGTILDGGTGDIFASQPDNPATPANEALTGVDPQTGLPTLNTTAPKDDDRPLTVTGGTVNEASRYLGFTVSGIEGQPVKLALQSDSGTVGTDTDTTHPLEYWNGSTWVYYDSQNPPTLPQTGAGLDGEPSSLQVRVRLAADGATEPTESLQLVATNRNGTPFAGTGYILDGGVGPVINEAPLSVNNVTVNEGDGGITVGGNTYTPVQFTVTGAPGQKVTLSYANQTTEAQDSVLFYGGGSRLEYLDEAGGNVWRQYTGAVDMPADGSLNVRLSVRDDGQIETTETFTLTATTATGLSSTGVGTILDNDTAGGLPEVNTFFVNEGSPFAVFTVTGVAGAGLDLSLGGGTATSGVDYVNAMEFFDVATSSWVKYNPAAPNAVVQPGGHLLVRVALGNDAPYEGVEIFNLTATYNNTGVTTGITVGGTHSGTAGIVDDGTGAIFLTRLDDPLTPANEANLGVMDGNKPQFDDITLKDDDRGVSVADVTVNEASPYIVFTLDSFVGQKLQVELYTGTASLGTDTGSTLQYWTGSAWVDYSPSSLIDVAPGAGELPGSPKSVLVRLAVVNDNPYEVSESFTLKATTATGKSDTATGTILDNGQGTIFTGAVSNGAPVVDNATPKNDDRPYNPAFINNLMINEGSPWAVFTITGVPTAQLSLSLPASTTAGDATRGTDYQDGLQAGEFQVYIQTAPNTWAWVDYDPNANFPAQYGTPTNAALKGNAVLDSNGQLLVRVKLENQTAFEGDEPFGVSLQYTGNWSQAANLSQASQPQTGRVFTGTAVIVDDGTGSVFGNTNTTGVPTTPGQDGTPARLDDDRPLVVGNATVNEGSPYIVLPVTGKAGQWVKLDAASGTATLGTDTGSTMEYWNGSAWVPYTAGSFVQIPSVAGQSAGTEQTLLVRLAVTNDTTYERSESFTLTATNTGGTTSAPGTGTILDNGEGTVFATGVPGNPSGVTLDPITNRYVAVDLPAAPRNDDRTVSVNSVTVNEASPFAVFTVNAAQGEPLELSLASGSANVGTDTSGRIEYYDATTQQWRPYVGLPITVPANGNTPVVPMLVRVAVNADTANEGEETFTLTAKYADGNRASATGTGTILDDGTGDIFVTAADNPATPADEEVRGVNRDGTPAKRTLANTPVANPAALPVGTVLADDDRPVTVNDVSVNEGSPFAVFTVSAREGQYVKLDLAAGTATANGDYVNALEYWDGDSWEAYAPGTFVKVPTDGDATANEAANLLVRVAIKPDTLADNGETFTLTATNTGGTSDVGVGTILDDGRGDVFASAGLADGVSPATSRTPAQAVVLPKATDPVTLRDSNHPVLADDDRPLVVDDVELNEASGYVMWQVHGQPQQYAQLSVASGSAAVGTDTAPASALQYFNGQQWLPYTADSFVKVPASGVLLVRLAVSNDFVYEGPETLTLTATNTGGTGDTGTATIRDDGKGLLFGQSNTTGMPDTLAALGLQVLDDDRVAPPVPQPAVILPAVIEVPKPPAPPALHVHAAALDAQSAYREMVSQSMVGGGADLLARADRLIDKFDRVTDPNLFVLPQVKAMRLEAADLAQQAGQWQSAAELNQQLLSYLTSADQALQAIKAPVAQVAPVAPKVVDEDCRNEPIKKPIKKAAPVAKPVQDLAKLISPDKSQTTPGQMSFSKQLAQKRKLVVVQPAKPVCQD